MKGHKYVEGVFQVQQVSFLALPCMYTSSVEICKTTTHLISGVEGVQECMRSHHLREGWRVDDNEITSVLMVKGLSVHVGLLSAGCTLSQPARRSVTSVKGHAIYIYE